MRDPDTNEWNEITGPNYVSRNSLAVDGQGNAWVEDDSLLYRYNGQYFEEVSFPGDFGATQVSIMGDHIAAIGKHDSQPYIYDQKADSWSKVPFDGAAQEVAVADDGTLSVHYGWLE